MKNISKIPSNIMEAFNKMIGIDDIDEHIIANKYDNIFAKLHSFIEVLKNIFDNEVLDFKEDVYEFVTKSEINMNECTLTQSSFITDLHDVNGSNNVTQSLIDRLSVCRYNKDQLLKVYNDLQIMDPMISIISFVNILSPKIKLYKESHPDLSSIDCICEDMFLLSQNGVIFPFSRLDIRNIFVVRDEDEEKKKYIIRAVKLLYKTATDVLKEVSQPNISPDEYIEVIETAVINGRKKVPRCNEAFDVMTNSTGMFREKFNIYYKHFLESGNPSIILQDFVSDVADLAKNAGENPQLKRQFKEIFDVFGKELSNNSRYQDLIASAKEQTGFDFE
jgi:hypothetical protein